MRKLFQKMTAVALSATLVVGMTGVVPAAVATGTDVVGSTNWSSYSIYTHEDHVDGESKAKLNVCWYHSLLNTNSVLTNQHYVGDTVTDSQLEALNAAIKADNEKNKKTTPTVTKHADTWGEQDAYKCFGENAKITEQTSSGFTMDVVSTGWNANWGPTGRDDKGNLVYGVMQSNPWGVTATKVVNVERGRTYTISFKIKSTLQNELKETKEREDGTGYNVGTGKYNYIKHIHFKAYDNTDTSGAALSLSNMKATIGSKSVLDTSVKDFKPFVALDSQNTEGDGWVTVSADVKIPVEKADYQAKKANPTMGIMFAFGAFLKEYLDENDMSGTIQVSDFKVTAGAQSPAQAKISKITAKKKKLVVKLAKAARATAYQVKYSTKKKVTGARTVTTKKTSVTLKKLKAKTTYYVKARGYYTSGGKTTYGAFSAIKSKKTK